MHEGYPRRAVVSGTPRVSSTSLSGHRGMKGPGGISKINGSHIVHRGPLRARPGHPDFKLFGFKGGKACLACLYMPSGVVKSEDEKIAEELRLPEAKQEVRELLQRNEGVSENFVQRVATAFAVPYPDLQPFVGESLRSFYQKAICGGLMVGLTGLGKPGRPWYRWHFNLRWQDWVSRQIS